MASGLKHLSNALATPDQLSNSSSSIDNVPSDLETSIRCAGAQLTQAAGVLLHLSQDIIAQAVVIFTRFWLGADGGSLRIYSVKDVSAAALYLTAKLSFQPTSPRSVLNVYTLLLSQDASPLWFVRQSGAPEPLHPPKHISCPREAISLPAVAQRVIQHLNAALLSPQLLYVTHQPNALAVAAIYLASREEGVKLVDSEWWEVFDVDREELGFLVVGMKSTEGFMRVEISRWKNKAIPMVVDEVDSEIERRRMMEEGE
ncbi:hypothetical protein N7491_000373 [Penicillium cf. griseofulvum]|nr:hypothetical protein N7491_000373 [Penicillium cf. griseofulvum]